MSTIPIPHLRSICADRALDIQHGRVYFMYVLANGTLDRMGMKVKNPIAKHKYHLNLLPGKGLYLLLFSLTFSTGRV
jgi:hypothetical protein